MPLEAPVSRARRLTVVLLAPLLALSLAAPAAAGVTVPTGGPASDPGTERGAVQAADVRAPGPDPGEVLPAPTGVVATVRGDRRVTLTWDPVEGAARYAVHEVRTLGRPVATVTEPTRTSRRLARGTYTYTVTALAADGSRSAASTPVPVTVPTRTRMPAPASAPAGDRAPQVPATATLVWDGGWDTGGSSQWETCQNRSYNASCARFSGNYSLSTTTAAREGSHAARFEVRDGDIPSFGGGERSEATAPDVVDIAPGDERWYQFSLKFDEGYTCEAAPAWVIVSQWHAGSGSPPMALMVDARCRLVLTNNVTRSGHKVIGDIADGQWVDYVVHAVHSTSAADGWVEVYRDGELVVPQHARASMADSSSYFKQGIYRGGGTVSTGVMHLDGTKVWKP
jgi:hypothetical protein